MQLYVVLFLRDSHLDHPIHHLHGVRGDVHNGGQLHGFPISHVEFTAVPRADDIKAFQVSISHRPIIVRTDIANGKELVRDVEDNQRTAFDLDK